MKINQIFIIIFFNLLYFYNIQSFFNADDFDNNLIDQIDTIEKSINESFDRLQSQIFKNYTRKKTTDNNVNQNITHLPLQQKNNFYQQTSCSLSFSNQEKAISITEQKDQYHEFYTFKITDKSSNSTRIDDSKNNAIEELKALLYYINNNFTVTQAEKIIKNCLKNIEEDNKNKLISIEIAEQDNYKEYTIKISYEQKNKDDKETDTNNNIDIEIEDDQKDRRKKKKLHHYKPTSKEKKQWHNKGRF